MRSLPAFLKMSAWPVWVSGGCGLLCAVLGAAVMAGWHLGNVPLVRIEARFVPMQYVTAICFLISGTGLVAFALRMPRGISMFCGALAGAAGLGISLEYVTGWNPAFNALMRYFPKIEGVVAGNPPPPTAAGFAMAGTAILLLRMAVPVSTKRLLIWILGSSSVALGLMALCAYRLGVRMMFISGDSIGMAAHSAAGLMVLGIGVLAAQVTSRRALLEDPWLPVPFGFGTIVAALMLWQALAADRTRAVREQAQVIAENVAADAESRFTFCLRSLERIARRWEAKGGGPYSQWLGDANDCLRDQSVFEAVGHTDGMWKVDYAEADPDAEPLLGRDFRQDKRWDAAAELTDSILHHEMLISPTLPVRGEDKGFYVFFPTFVNNEFRGFVFGVFRLLDLKKDTLEQPAFATCRIAVYKAGQFILGELPVEPEGARTRAESSTGFREHVWKFVVEPKSSVLAGGKLPGMILGLGVLLGGTVSVAVWAYQHSVSRTAMALTSNRQLEEENRERRMVEAELRETLRAKRKSQALLKSAGRIAQLGHWELAMGADGPTWSDITYHIHEVPLGTPITLRQALEFYHPDDRPMISECVREAMEQGVAHEFEARLVTASGRMIWIYSRGEPVKDENGKVIAIHGVFQNIDERRKAAELLKRRNEELEAATARAEAHARAKTEFLANMSHEIRTPMNAVLGMSELLMHGQLDTREREFVETIHASGEVLLSLINDILDFSKIESGQLDLEHIPVPLRECAESVLDLLGGQAARKGLDLMCWVDPALPATVLGDPTRLRQVLVNLASNAVKFTSRGEVFLRLSLEKSSDGPLLKVEVSDTGIGIPAAGMDRLFGVFSQVDASTTRRFGGTGLGLAISQRLVGHMGGRIEVKSAVDEGTTFYFSLPITTSSPPPAPPPVPHGAEGLRVLVVDDNAHSRWLLTRHLSACRMAVTAVEGPEAALREIHNGEGFDLVIIDSVMPGKCSYTLAASIGDHGVAGCPRIIMLGSIADPVPDPRPPGVASVVNKPIKTGPLHHALRNALSTAALPKSQPSPPVVIPSGSHVAAAASAGPDKDAEKPALIRPLRILVAEDNPMNQKVVALHLQRMGYECSMAGNGLEALTAVRDGEFDVLLLDVQMPEMDGLEAAREICRRHPFPERPWMIALTANAFGNDRDECLAAGMDDYLSKPVRAGNLQRALHAAWDERHRHQRQGEQEQLEPATGR